MVRRSRRLSAKGKRSSRSRTKSKPKRRESTGRGVRCSKRKPCRAGLVCHPVEHKCYRYDDEEMKGYNEAFSKFDIGNVDITRQGTRWDRNKKPGLRGFNSYARKRLEIITKKNWKITCPKPGTKPKPQAYQKAVSFMVHPARPFRRMLVAHRTGAGKTFTMIKVLNNFYADRRPKVLIFPNVKIRNNFYQELLFFPNRYKTWLERKLGPGKAKPSNLKAVIDALAMKGRLRHAGKPGELVAPLRAYRYTIAGGSTVFGRRGPTDPVFKRMYDGRNPYSNKIIIMDEVHNLVKPDEETRKYMSKLRALKRGLTGCENSVLVALTATPVVNEPVDAQELLKVVKGPRADELNNEGFVSWFQSAPKSVFPVVSPGDPTSHWPTPMYVTLEGVNWKKYKTERKKKTPLKMLNFCNAGQSYRASIKPTTKFRKLLTTQPRSAATKLAVIAEKVLNAPHKSLVIVHREDGFRVLEALLEEEAKRRYRHKQGGCTTPFKCWLSLYEKPTRKDEELLRVFNSAENARGKLIKVLLVDAKFYAVGISFLDIRTFWLADMARSYADYLQRVGRVIRFCGHRHLPRDEWNVHLVQVIARLPDKSLSADEFYFNQIKQEKAALQPMWDELRTVAVDKGMYANL